jgi:hypothetical protein
VNKPASIQFACRCGEVTGTLNGVDPDEGTHVVCHCNSCRRAMEKSGLADEAQDGVALFQTTPDRIRIATGMGRLAPRQLSPKGLLRWQATCCNTPMFNTLSGPAIPFAGVLVRNLDSAAPLGPVIAHGFIDKGNGKQGHENGPTVIWRFLKRAALARLTGKARQNPFFGSDSKPVAKPQLFD